MEDDYTDWIKAGRLAAEARDYGASLIKPGASLLDVAQKVEKFVLDKGAKLAFPCTLNINNIAAHFTPTFEDKTVFGDDDLVKIDVGTNINGAIGDTAKTVDLGNNYKELLKISMEARDNAIKIMAPGVTTGEIGRVVGETITSAGFQPVRNLSGHGLKRFVVHTSPSIPNFNTHEKTELKVGQTIACEPFATEGKGEIYEIEQSEILKVLGTKPLRGQVSRQVLKEIENQGWIYFAPRWLATKFPYFKVIFALKEMNQLGMLSSHPPLLEVNKGMVSQHEHTILIEEKGAKVLTKTDED